MDNRILPIPNRRIKDLTGQLLYRFAAAYEAAIVPVFAIAILMQPVEAGLLVLAPAAVLSVALARLSGRLWAAA